MVIVGIDEVGRGCWAGPVVAGAVILKESIEGLTDSKLLSKKRRLALAAQIHASATVGLGWVEAGLIDEIGLTAAVGLAMERALEEIVADYDQVIIDGNHNFLAHNRRASALVKADLTVPAVSAASIVAKVARDAYMLDIAADYKDYGFDKHVGYGTAMHLERLKLHGVSELHRRSFAPVAALLQ